jgi:dTDP-glucose 4,6-dehydratase
MKRVLVTGGAGFLGHHLVEHILKNTDWEVIVLDSLTYASGGYDRLRDIGCFDDRRVVRFTHDLSMPFTPGLERELGNLDYIAHCAAETHVDRSIRDPWPFIQSNLIGTARILDFAKNQTKLDRMVYFSTDEVFGPADLYGNLHVDKSHHTLSPFYTYREWDRYNSTNPYSATKAGAEELCLAWANTYGVPVVITHCMNLFGERQHPEKFIPNTIRKLLHGEKIIIHADPSKTNAGSRIYLHARNASDAVLFLFEHGVRRDKYNIAGQRECTNLEVASLIADKMRVPLSYELVDFHSSRPGHDLRYSLDGSKLDRIGWKAPVDFDASLHHTIDWFLEHPQWLEA